MLQLLEIPAKGPANPVLAQHALTELASAPLPRIVTIGQSLETVAAPGIRIFGELESGGIVEGESAIVSTRGVRRVRLQPGARPSPAVLRAIINAEGIVVGPGHLYANVIPSLLVEGIASTIFGVNAVRIYLADLAGPAGAFTVDEHLHAIRSHTGFDLFDYVLVKGRGRKGGRPVEESVRTLVRAGRP